MCWFGLRLCFASLVFHAHSSGSASPFQLRNDAMPAMRSSWITSFVRAASPPVHVVPSREWQRRAPSCPAVNGEHPAGRVSREPDERLAAAMMAEESARGLILIEWDRSSGGAGHACATRGEPLSTDQTPKHRTTRCARRAGFSSRPSRPLCDVRPARRATALRMPRRSPPAFAGSCFPAP